MDIRQFINSSQVRVLDTLRHSLYFDIYNNEGIKDGELLRLHPETRTVEVVKRKSIERALGPQTVTIRGNTITNWSSCFASQVFRPDVPKIVFEEDSRFFINSYRPPVFLEDTFWDISSQLPVYNIETKLPIDYEQPPKAFMNFLMHLTNYEFDSLEYLMQWLATALTPGSRNITTLVLISRPGVGKGVLFDSIIKPLFGEHNARLVRGDDFLMGRFNDALFNKQFVIFDESRLSDERTLNRFKALANTDLEIEKKGKDTFNTKNWLNTMITSNNLDSIRLEDGDRRFSILQTSDKSLEMYAISEGYKDVPALKAELESPENVAAVYKWLREFKVERNMNIPFTAITKTEEIKNASLHEWNRALIDMFNDKIDKNMKTITLTEIQDYVVQEGLLNKKPGRPTITEFLRKCDKCYLLRKDKNNKHFVKLERKYIIADGVEEDDSVSLAQPISLVTSIRSKVGVGI